jgi:hypothetical protein
MDLMEGMQPPFEHIYNLSQDELVVLHETLMKTSKGVHSVFKISNWCPYPLDKKIRWLFVNVCRLSWTKSIHHQESIPFTLDLKVVGTT